MQQIRVRIFAFFAVFSIVILFFISPDSYLHGIEGHSDSGVFYMYGKAMMKGMIPYIDFNEGKGPLLFLIYGLGYLLSNTSYLGVFWISCTFYTAVFYLTYKTVNLFVNSEKKAVASSIIMSIAYFNPLLHYEFRCEDFSQLFIITSLYAICRLLYTDDKSFVGKAGFLQGISLAATMLLKFNVSAMLSVFIIYGLFYTYKQQSLIKYILWGFAGISVILFPFWFYFYINGAWPQCLYDFLLVTEFTVRGTGGDPSVTYLNRLSQNFSHPAHLVVFVTTLFGTLLFARQNTRNRYFPLISFLFFYFITLQNGAWHYYYSVCSVFYIFLIIPLLGTITHKEKSLIMITSATLFVVVPTNMWRAYNFQKLFFQESQERQAYYKYSYLMSQVKDAKYVKMGGFANLDVLSGALPGCKYMAFIPGEPKAITNERMQIIKEKRVDFVQVGRGNDTLKDELVSWGYYSYDFGSSILLYSPLKLKLPANDFYVSSADVLHKRNVAK